jgi:hypothetical protein
MTATIYRQQKVLSHFPVCCWIDWLLMIKNYDQNCLIESGSPCRNMNTPTVRIAVMRMEALLFCTIQVYNLCSRFCALVDNRLAHEINALSLREVHWFIKGIILRRNVSDNDPSVTRCVHMFYVPLLENILLQQ